MVNYTVPLFNDTISDTQDHGKFHCTYCGYGTDDGEDYMGHYWCCYHSQEKEPNGSLGLSSQLQERET